jgi:mono/diheme cytochrome c family protein
VLRPLATIAALGATLTLGLAACGEEVEVPREQAALRDGAQLFRERCSGCHTLDAAGSRGSKPTDQVSGGERTNGPNFNTRKVSRDDTLFAIRNGGFSGAIMPANIVVGREAQKVADFLARYSGQQAGDTGQATESSQQGGQGGGDGGLGGGE